MSGPLLDAEPFGEVWVAHTGGRVACAAVWLPPGAYPRNQRRDATLALRAVPTMARSGRRGRAALRLLNATEVEHKKVTEPHFYLAVLGTDPCFQRSGAGSAALQPVLDRCDSEGLPAYLETQKEENLAYYARHGFELVQQLDIKGVPPIWTMLRNPR
jgi:GNAT superfamily N-acetyltransferase